MEKSKKLTEKNIENIFALTPMQQGMLYHYLQDPQGVQYFEQLCLDISGPIDIKCFEQAWDIVIKRNEMLRAVFRWEKLEHPVQIILKEHKCNLHIYDLSGKDTSQTRQPGEEIKAKDRQETFDLGQVPFRVILCKIEENKYQVIISNHHILYDGWSTGIILKEFFEAYHTLILDKTKAKDSQWIKGPAKSSFKEFIQWMQSQDKTKQKQFWEEYLSGFETRTELPIKIKNKETSISTRDENYPVILPGAVKDQLESFIKRQRVTLASFFYSVWGILLHRYCNSDDVIFGTSVSGRNVPLKGIDDMVGLFINTIPLRIRIRKNEKITDLLYRVNDTLALREKYQSTPLVDIKEYSKVENHAPLFDSIIVLENYPLDRGLMQKNNQNQPGQLVVDSYSIVSTTTYHLTIGITIGDNIETSFHYHPSLFEKSSIIRLYSHFNNIVKNILNQVEKDITGIEILSGEEKRQILYDFNHTEPEPDSLTDKAVHELFEHQVEKIPTNIALIETQTNLHLTYRELNRKANQLAYLLRGMGVKADTTAAIMMERSVAMVVGMMGIIKAGGAYLPIDPGYPGARIRYMLKDSAIKTVLLGDRRSNKLKSRGNEQDGVVHVYVNEEICQPSYRGKTSNKWDSNPDHITHGENLFYIIYTSGSTGKPKGVLVKHSGFVNLVYCHQEVFGEGPGERLSQVANQGFDAMASEVWPCLSNGGTLFIADNETRINPTRMKEWLIEKAITITFQPTVIAEQLLMEEWSHLGVSLRVLRTAGEQLTRYPGFHLPFQLYNLYGPTEDTVWTTWTEVKAEQKSEKYPSIGKPIARHRVYIMGAGFRLQPLGVGGELCIAGQGLAVGYLNQPELIIEKFAADPFNPRKKMYKTGDRARWSSQGDIEFLGRIDYQVKIRGFRIETGEIETHLLKHEQVKEAVVLARGDDNRNKYLCAYIVPTGKCSNLRVPGLELELRKYLSVNLTPYMIPSYFVILDKMPLTPNGKVDRKALPVPALKAGDTYVPPRDNWEERLVDIWSQLLGVEIDAIGIDDNFFHRGGHSLKATALVSKIHKEFDVIIPLAKLFETPTIRRLSQYIKEEVEEQYISIQTVEKQEYYSLSSGQKRLYFLQQMDETATAYNMPTAWRLEGKIDKDRLENTFRELIQRHDSLRTSVVMAAAEPVQKIHEEVEFEIEYNDLEEVKVEEKHLEGTRGLAPLLRNFIRPFDLSHAPLLRVGLVELLHTPTAHRGHPSQEGKKDKYLLMVDMHHIISDGISAGLLVQDFMTLYPGEPLPGVKLQYKDYAQWQNREKEGIRLVDQGRYWLKEFEGEIPVLEIPTDYPRPAVQQFEGSSLDFEVDRETTYALTSLALAEGATLYMVLLALYTILLSKLTNQEDIVIGAPVAGRKHADLEKIIGMFVNTLALRNYPTGEKTFTAFLAEVKRKTLTAFENQEYPYEDLVEQVVINRDVSRNPLFDASFLLQNVEISELAIPGLKLIPYEYETVTSKFDLMLEGRELNETLQFRFEYSTKLFK
ncbi:MAG: amino acid adenylation domain-containing protein, partial [Candidatus Aminicenantes bacterium]